MVLFDVDLFSPCFYMESPTTNTIKCLILYGMMINFHVSFLCYPFILQSYWNKFRKTFLCLDRNKSLCYNHHIKKFNCISDMHNLYIPWLCNLITINAGKLKQTHRQVLPLIDSTGRLIKYPRSNVEQNVIARRRRPCQQCFWASPTACKPEELWGGAEEFLWQAFSRTCKEPLGIGLRHRAMRRYILSCVERRVTWQRLDILCGSII